MVCRLRLPRTRNQMRLSIVRMSVACCCCAVCKTACMDAPLFALCKYILFAQKNPLVYPVLEPKNNKDVIPKNHILCTYNEENLLGVVVLRLFAETEVCSQVLKQLVVDLWIVFQVLFCIVTSLCDSIFTN